MQPYGDYSNTAVYSFPSILILMSLLFQQMPIGAGSAALKEFMIGHIKNNTVASVHKRIGLLPTPSLTSGHSNRKGETPSDDRAFFPPYVFPFWGLPYGIYSKGGFFNPGLFPFVPGGPGFPPYDGIFGGPYGPGKYPGPGPTPFQGGSNTTMGGGGGYQPMYPPYYGPPPKRNKKKKYKKKCCTTTTTPPPDTTTTSPPDTTTTATPMDDYPKGYRQRNYPRYRSPPSYHYGYDPTPPPPQYAYPPPQPQMPYPVIIQAPYVMPQQQHYYMPPPPMYSPYGVAPPMQSSYGGGGYPGQQPVAVHNFFATPPNHYQPNPYIQPIPMEYYASTTSPSTTTAYTTTTEATTTTPSTTTAPPSTTTMPTYAPVYYVQTTPMTYITPPPSGHYSQGRSNDQYGNYWNETPVPSSTPPHYHNSYNSYNSRASPVKRETFTTAITRSPSSVQEDDPDTPLSQGSTPETDALAPEEPYDQEPDEGGNADGDEIHKTEITSEVSSSRD